MPIKVSFIHFGLLKKISILNLLLFFSIQEQRIEHHRNTVQQVQAIRLHHRRIVPLVQLILHRHRVIHHRVHVTTIFSSQLIFSIQNLVSPRLFTIITRLLDTRTITQIFPIIEIFTAKSILFTIKSFLQSVSSSPRFSFESLFSVLL